jgi:hypothetical protein
LKPLPRNIIPFRTQEFRYPRRGCPYVYAQK